VHKRARDSTEARATNSNLQFQRQSREVEQLGGGLLHTLRLQVFDRPNFSRKERTGYACKSLLTRSVQKIPSKIRRESGPVLTIVGRYHPPNNTDDAPTATPSDQPRQIISTPFNVLIECACRKPEVIYFNTVEILDRENRT